MVDFGFAFQVFLLPQRGRILRETCHCGTWFLIALKELVGCISVLVRLIEH